VQHEARSIQGRRRRRLGLPPHGRRERLVQPEVPVQPGQSFPVGAAAAPPSLLTDTRTRALRPWARRRPRGVRGSAPDLCFFTTTSREQTSLAPRENKTRGGGATWRTRDFSFVSRHRRSGTCCEGPRGRERHGRMYVDSRIDKMNTASAKPPHSRRASTPRCPPGVARSSLAGAGCMVAAWRRSATTKPCRAGPSQGAYRRPESPHVFQQPASPSPPHPSPIPPQPTPRRPDFQPTRRRPLGKHNPHRKTRSRGSPRGAGLTGLPHAAGRVGEDGRRPPLAGAGGAAHAKARGSGPVGVFPPRRWVGRPTECLDPTDKTAKSRRRPCPACLRLGGAGSNRDPALAPHHAPCN